MTTTLTWHKLDDLVPNDNTLVILAFEDPAFVSESVICTYFGGSFSVIEHDHKAYDFVLYEKVSYVWAYLKHPLA